MDVLYHSTTLALIKNSAYKFLKQQLNDEPDERMKDDAMLTHEWLMEYGSSPTYAFNQDNGQPYLNNFLRAELLRSMIHASPGPAIPDAPSGHSISKYVLQDAESISQSTPENLNMIRLSHIGPPVLPGFEPQPHLPYVFEDDDQKDSWEAISKSTSR